MASKKKSDGNIVFLKVAVVSLMIAVAVLAIMLAVTMASVSSLYSTINSLKNQSSSQTTPPVTFAGLDQPLNASMLGVLNNQPLTKYELAGQGLLNGSYASEVLISNNSKYKPYVVNGKPSVIYIGAITCPYCSENRWAMVLALAQFGNFSALYQGYSAAQDGDIPTIYFSKVDYNTSAGVDFNNSYSSKYINFISADYESPISGRFQVGPISYFIAHSPNATYSSAMSFMNSTNKFGGTPFTFWGGSLFTGADGVVLVNGSWTSMQAQTHAQIINQINAFNTTFSKAEFAAADVYISKVCPAINNTAQVCSLPAIRTLENLTA